MQVPDGGTQDSQAQIPISVPNPEDQKPDTASPIPIRSPPRNKTAGSCAPREMKMARQAPRIPRGLAQPLADARLCFTSLAGGETPRITLGQGGGGRGMWDTVRPIPPTTAPFSTIAAASGTQWEKRPFTSATRRGRTFTSSIPSCRWRVWDGPTRGTGKLISRKSHLAFLWDESLPLN